MCFHFGSRTCSGLLLCGLLFGLLRWVGSVSGQSPAELPGDELLLKGGRVLPAQIVEPEAKEDWKGKPRTLVELRTAAGGKLRLEKGKVVTGVKLASDELAAYREFTKSLGDTVAEHWKAVEWCEAQSSGKLKLADQINYHLRRIVALDENDAKAQKALGNTDINGRWVNEELFYRSRGYFREGSTWRSRVTGQLNEFLDAGKSTLGDVKEGMAKWKRAIAKSSDLQLTTQRVQAVQDLQSLISPATLPYVCEQFDAEKREAVQEIYLEAIAMQKNRYSLGKVVDVALTHPRPVIRERALSYLKQYDRDDVASQANSYLGSADNSVVANAGVLLGEMESSRAILPLIKHLKTQHKVKNPNAKQAGQIDTGFDSQGGGGLSLGGGGPTTVNVLVENKDVESALKRITKVDFGFNETDWMRWYVQNHTLNHLDLRADD
ncbi:MAG: hypothetical protein ACK6DB_18575 [Planctomycetota bacterium]